MKVYRYNIYERYQRLTPEGKKRLVSDFCQAFGLHLQNFYYAAKDNAVNKGDWLLWFAAWFNVHPSELLNYDLPAANPVQPEEMEYDFFVRQYTYVREPVVAA